MARSKIPLRRWLLAGGLLAAAVLIMTRLSGAPQHGLVDGRLRPCPASPNCVCSQETPRRVNSLPLHGTPSASLDRLEIIVEAAGGEVMERRDNYLRAEFRTRAFRFVDDVEFLAVDGQVHVRSASRSGYWDWGVNRRRVDKIRRLYEAPPASEGVPRSGPPSEGAAPSDSSTEPLSGA